MSSFFINRPIVAMVIAIVTVIGGLIAMRGLPLAQFPEIVPPQIIVSTTYTGADAVTIEQSVSTPLEQQMNGVDNMLYMQSTNANDGTAQLTVTFGVETNVSIDQVNVQNRVAQAQPNLPTDVNQYGLTTRKSTGLPMLIISIFSPNNTYDALFLANYATININDVLYRVPGVGRCGCSGPAITPCASGSSRMCWPNSGSPCRTSPRRSSSRARSTLLARWARRRRPRAWRRRTRCSRRDGSRRRRSSARSSSAPTWTAPSCACRTSPASNWAPSTISSCRA